MNNLHLLLREGLSSLDETNRFHVVRIPEQVLPEPCRSNFARDGGTAIRDSRFHSSGGSIDGRLERGGLDSRIVQPNVVMLKEDRRCLHRDCSSPSVDLQSLVCPFPSSLNQSFHFLLHRHPSYRSRILLLPSSHRTVARRTHFPTPFRQFRFPESSPGFDPHSLNFVREEEPMRVDRPGFGVVVDPATFADPVDLGSVGVHSHPLCDALVFGTGRVGEEGLVRCDVLDEIGGKGVDFSGHEEAADHICGGRRTQVSMNTKKNKVGREGRVKRTAPVGLLSRRNPQMSLELTQDQEGIVIRLDDIIRLPESHSNRSLPRWIQRRFLIINRNRRVLSRPLKEPMRLSLVHIFDNVKNDDIVVHLHLEGDPPRVIESRSTEDEFELNILRGSPRSRVDGFRMTGVSRANELSSFVGGVDGEDTDEDVDGGERVGEGVGEGILFGAESTPGKWLLVVVEDVDEGGRKTGGEAAEEEEGEQDGEGLSGDPGLSEEGRAKR